jgi:hypothetical protein
MLSGVSCVSSRISALPTASFSEGDSDTANAARRSTAAAVVLVLVLVLVLLFCGDCEDWALPVPALNILAESVERTMS